MKRLYLLRHAKTLSAEIGQDDFTRELAPQGVSDSDALGKELLRKSYVPELVLCSPALRTEQTMKGVLKSLPSESVSQKMVEKIYDSSRGDLFAQIQDAPDNVHALMLIGHNPAIYELSVMLASDGRDYLIDRLTVGFKPGTVSVFDCDCKSWGDFQPDANTLIDLLEPLDYNAPATPARWT